MNRDRQIEKIGRALDASRSATARHDWAAAVRASMRAERMILRLQRVEPAETEHVWVLAGTCYDQALLWDRLGKGRQAVSAARRAVWPYHFLDPSKGDPRRVRDVLDAAAGDGAATAAELMAHAADAKARLARLLAKYQHQRRPGDESVIDRYRGHTVAGEVELLGRDAIGVYEVLVEASHSGQDDLDRVREQYKAAIEHLR
jgi:hypothetical protein